MAWLDTVMGGLNKAVGGQGNALTQLLSLFGANQAINKYNVATPAEKMANTLYQSILNPQSPLMTRLTAQERERNLSDFQTQLKEMQLADRRSASMGRANTFFNPERADETVAYLTSRGLPNINMLAQQNAVDRIKKAATGIGGFAGKQAYRQDVDANNMVNNFSLPQQIFKMFTQGGFSENPAPRQNTPMAAPAPNTQRVYYPNSRTWIDWDSP